MHRARDAGTHVAQDVGAAFDHGDEVVRPGDHGIGQHGRMLPEMRIGGSQQAVEVDVLDHADG